MTINNSSLVCLISIIIVLVSKSSASTLPPLPSAFPPLPLIFPNVSSIPPSSRPNSTAWDSFRKLGGCLPGEKKEGLSELKKYFRQFGYIDNSTAGNFTDQFDETLESAIRTYQRNYNLNETGELDNSTLDQIVKPRCGNADIVNGSTSMNSGKSSNYSSSHFHTVSHYSFFDGMPRWPSDKRDLTYAFLPDNQLSDTAKEVFGRAFDRWAEVIPMTFNVTDSYASADITIGFYTGDHGDGEAFDGVLGTLAHAFSPTSGRFHLDGAESWVVEGDITQSTETSAVDLESVAVHEIGHLLGLGHSSVEEAIMYSTITSGTRKVTLASDDVDGIQVLYGSNPNYNGTSKAESQQNDTNWARSVGPSWLLLAVGFAIIFV